MIPQFIVAESQQLLNRTYWEGPVEMKITLSFDKIYLLNKIIQTTHLIHRIL